MKTEDKAQLVAATTSIVICGIAGLCYLRVARTERKKREKIAAWQHENLSCIETSRARLLKIVEEGGSWKTLKTAMDEEAEFLSIVRNQPKY